MRFNLKQIRHIKRKCKEIKKAHRKVSHRNIILYCIGFVVGITLISSSFFLNIKRRWDGPADFFSCKYCSELRK